MTTLWGTLTLLGYLLTLALVPFVFLNKKRYPASTVAWILAIIVLPYLGGLLYVVFGINRVARRAALKKASRVQIGLHLPEVSHYQLLSSEEFTQPSEALMRLAYRVAGTRPTFGNRVEVIHDTNRALGLIEEAVSAAEQTIHLEYYIWQPDRTGTRLRDLLIRKAREGVKVRFLYDNLGSWFLSRQFLKPMLDAGIDVAPFLPGQSWRDRWSINLRSHRKIVIVDGTIGFTGGMNIGDEYLGRNPLFGFWRDTHLRLVGPTVLQLQQVFVEDWYFATHEQLTDRSLFPEPEEIGEQVAQVIAGGPDAEWDAMHAMFFAAISEARERVLLATSYFVPTPAIVMALETAAYRGVTVRLLLPRKSAHHYMVLAARSYYESLLESGVEIYEYTKGMLHSKTITIDGQWSMVGTPNLDTRSLQLNFEVAVAIYDARTASILEEYFEADLQQAERIDFSTWRSRPARQALAENAVRLFSPVL